jgi:threonine aldolase
MNSTSTHLKKGFGSDNHAPVHPQILQSILACNQGHEPSYGTDDLTLDTQKKFQKLFEHPVQTFFVFNGTAANVLALKAICKTYQSVFVSDVSHVNVDECGAPENIGGFKLIPIASHDGKITVEGLEKELKRRGDQHFSQPAVVSVTQPTEVGTVYSLEELKNIFDFCKKNSLLIHIDGARIANAVHSLKTSFYKMTVELGVDVVSFGGTKNGFLFGEAVVFINQELAKDFKFIRKQGCQLPSKTRYIACQFQAYLENQLWNQIAQHSHQMALLLEENLKKFSQVEITHPVQSNAVFAKFPREWIKGLREVAFFYIWDEKTFECRLMMSWDTQKEDIFKFIEYIQTRAT